jgi:hypothetical protein
MLTGVFRSFARKGAFAAGGGIAAPGRAGAPTPRAAAGAARPETSPIPSLTVAILTLRGLSFPLGGHA